MDGKLGQTFTVYVHGDFIHSSYKHLLTVQLYKDSFLHLTHKLSTVMRLHRAHKLSLHCILHHYRSPSAVVTNPLIYLPLYLVTMLVSYDREVVGIACHCACEVNFVTKMGSNLTSKEIKLGENCGKSMYFVYKTQNI